MFLYSSIERDALSSNVQVDSGSGINHEVERRKFLYLRFFLPGSPFLPEPVRIDDLSHMYPAFHGIYRKHVQNDKLCTVKGAEFRSLKERLVFVFHLLKDHQEMASENRTELIQALLSEDDLRHAQQLLPKSEKKDSGKTSWLPNLPAILSWSKEPDEESLRREMKKKARGISDSDFLLELKGIDDKDLETTIQQAGVFAHSWLSSLIDKTVEKMTHAVLWMQQEQCKKSLQREIDAEEGKALGIVLLKFIREINERSVGRGSS